jgi:hypothetical protein
MMRWIQASKFRNTLNQVGPESRNLKMVLSVKNRKICKEREHEFVENRLLIWVESSLTQHYLNDRDFSRVS